MGNTLILINTVLSGILLFLFCIILFLQLRPLKKEKKGKDKPQLNNEETLPAFNFFNGKIHSNGLVSMKLQNSGAKVSEINFVTDNENIEFRCQSEKLETREDATLSIVPRKFNFSDSYFESNDVLFSIKYLSLLNDPMEERFKIENINSVVKLG